MTQVKGKLQVENRPAQLLSVVEMRDKMNKAAWPSNKLVITQDDGQVKCTIGLRKGNIGTIFLQKGNGGHKPQVEWPIKKHNLFTERLRLTQTTYGMAKVGLWGNRVSFNQDTTVTIKRGSI